MMRTAISNFKISDVVIWCAVLILTVSAAQAATIPVTSNADAGNGTLREAIIASNTSVGVFDTINFSVTSIALTTPLPAITDPVMIDGGTTPTVELNGLGTQGAGIGSIGLWIRAGGCTVQGLIINRFGEAGIRMDTDGVGTDNANTIIGNYIGTNAAGNSATCGTDACGNVNRGILIVGTTGHFIGNGTAAGRNVISANSGRGIDINAVGSATINGNYIGTDVAGTADLGNLSHGIQIVDSSNSAIGGTAAGDRNVISGNNGNGIAILTDFGFTASNNVVQGNYIGVDVGGNTALHNNGSGVVVQAGGNTIGSATGGGGRNIISGNATNGVTLSTNFAAGNTVSGNYVGVGADGTTAIANSNNGVQISNLAADNTIGGTGVTPEQCNNSCNLIANNGAATSTGARAGIYVDGTAGVGNALRGNSIVSNGTPTGLGIDLGAVGVTANDSCDSDSGPNNLQNFPVISSASSNPFAGGGFVNIISGSLNSTASTTFTLEFFINTALDPTTSGEGETFRGSTTVTTDGTCTANFTIFLLTANDYAGKFLTATATDPANNTSEFSQGQPIGAGPTSAPATISGRITTPDGSPLGGTVMHLSGAATRTTVTDSAGNYHFDNLDTGNLYTVTPSRMNYHFNPDNRSFSLLANKTDAVFTATADAVISGNAIDTAEFFVRQHYLDFLGREPDEAGFNFWSDQMLECGADVGCLERRRINVSAAYFLSIEFQETGGLVDGLYRASYGVRPQFAEFMPDTATVAQGVVVGNGDWAQRLAANKQAFIDAWVQRPAFQFAYGDLTNASYVDRLISHTGVSFSQAERDALVGGLNGGTSTRANVLRQIAENNQFVNAKRNQTFVMMQYFGYLRRDPDESGYQFWLRKLNQFNGNFEQAEMVKAFLVSGEYRQRFVTQ